MEYKILPFGDKRYAIDTIRDLESAKALAIDQVWSFVERVEISDERVVVHLNKPIEFVFHDDLCFTIRGEFGILGADRIAIDGKEIYLNSRNCKQLRDFKETLVEEILLKIKPLGELEHNQPIVIDELKEQIKEELRNELHDIILHYLGKRRS
jgi:hypothetical protein